MIIRHPAFPSVTRDVLDAKSWVDQGWVADSPPVEPEPESEPDPTPRRRSRSKRD